MGQGSDAALLSHPSPVLTQPVTGIAHNDHRLYDLGLVRRQMDVKGQAFVGTSGWNYKHWRGVIYEPGFSQKKWLERIAATFDTVEVNTSFYRIPKPETVESWAQATPPSFQFALKLWRGITHYRKLKNAGDLTQRFLDSAEALPEMKRGPVLIQLPPNQGPDADKLKAYVEEFCDLAPGAWRLAVEFRNDAWLQPAIYKMLDKLDVAVCIHDMTGAGATDKPNDASLVYMRRHGPTEHRYAGSYSPEQIAHDAARIRRWMREGKDVYVYYNNDIGGHAFYNARDLRAALSR